MVCTYVTALYMCVYVFVCVCVRVRACMSVYAFRVCLSIYVCEEGWIFFGGGGGGGGSVSSFQISRGGRKNLGRVYYDARANEKVPRFLLLRLK